METTTPEHEQSTPQFSLPQQEHEWLQKLVGEWTFESECLGEPGKPTETFRGAEIVRSLGGLWIVGEGKGEMPGVGVAHTMITLGFDPTRGRFVGTWVGSMMTHLWIYEGQLDPSGRVLALESAGPDFTQPGKMAKYQDVITVESEDHRILTSRVLGENGEWTHFMTAHYRRQK